MLHHLTYFLKLAVWGFFMGVFTSCGQLPAPGGGVITGQYHPAGLPCGFPAGMLFDYAPPEADSAK